MGSSTRHRPPFPLQLPIPSLPSPLCQRFHKPRLQWSRILVVAACLIAPAVSTVVTPAMTAHYPGETALHIAVDTMMPVFRDGAWTEVEVLPAHELRRRQEEDQAEEPAATTTEAPSNRDKDRNLSSSDSPSSTTNGSTTTDSTSDSPSALPSPFDHNLDFNFTSNDGMSCPTYLNYLLTNQTFKSCYPLSMMLQTSKSFFDAEKKLQSIVTVLDATCAADLDFCTTYLKTEAASLVSPANCGEEYRRGQNNILQAYYGLMAFEVLYKATCLRERDSGMYCFANAVTNDSTPANAYFYFLPLNVSLPKTSKQACTTCLQETMAIFQSAAAERRQAIADTYKPAAELVNADCGPDFVNATLPAPLKDSWGVITGPSWVGLCIGLLVAVGMELLA